MKVTRTISTVEVHTGGEPFRIVTSGFPRIPGATILARRKWLGENLDEVRRALMFEPRGHADMYGGFLVPANDSGAHFGVLFWHKDGYSTACGHGTIALGVWAVESGLVDALPDGRTWKPMMIASEAEASSTSDSEICPTALEIMFTWI